MDFLHAEAQRRREEEFERCHFICGKFLNGSHTHFKI